MAQEYKNAKSFKEAVRSRLRKFDGNNSANHTRLIFTRLLARLSEYFEERVVLKGGFALELRIDSARTTRDIDLSIIGSPDQILIELNEAGSLDLGDFMRFQITAGKKIQNVQYDGQEFRVICTMANQVYGSFRIDVVFGEAFGRTDILPTKNYLEFAGIPPTYIQIYSIETHIAEKLHAYSMVWEKNSRVKDFPDLALLASIRPIRWDILRSSLDHIFKKRGTHNLPNVFPEPPIRWNGAYEKMVEENDLTWKNMQDLFETISTFLNPALGAEADLIWDPDTWTWR